VTAPRRTGEREILERSIHAIAQHARDAYALVEELDAAGFPPDGPTVLAAKRLRMQPLTTKGDLERELGRFVRDCRRCQRTGTAFDAGDLLTRIESELGWPPAEDEPPTTPPRPDPGASARPARGPR
jgi:hypothetical protein